MGKGKTLYVSDLDGTLLSPESIVSDKSRRMLNEAISNGALFTVATARTPATLARLLEGIDMPLPAIVMTGCALWDSKRNKYHDVRFMKSHEARRLYDIYKANGLPTFIYTLHAHKIHIYHTGQLSDLDLKFIAERTGSPYKEFHIPASGESEIPDEVFDRVLLFYTMRGDEEVGKVYEILKNEDFCNPVSYFDMYGSEVRIMEVFSNRTSKAAAVKELAGAIGADCITVFGDNVNDLSMLSVADIPVAVENAIDAVKSTAKIIIGPNSSDSVAGYILEQSKKLS